MIVGGDELLAAVDKQHGEVGDAQRIVRVVQRAANRANERGDGRDEGGVIDPGGDGELRSTNLAEATSALRGRL